MSSRGFSLIELIVVIAIIGILLSIATLDFRSMQQKGQIEKQIREIRSDLVGLRIDAMQKKRRSAAFFGPNVIQFYSYSSNDEPVLTRSTLMSTKNLSFIFRRLSSTTQTDLNAAVDRVEYDTRGYAINNITIFAMPVAYNALENCIIVSTANTQIGRMVDASTCRAR